MLADFRHAFRQLARKPGFAVVTILTLALGIGLNTSMFSLMNLVALKPLPYPQRDELVRIYRTTPQSNSADHSAPDFFELARATESFARLATFRQWAYTLTFEGRAPVNLSSIRVSAGFLPTLGLQPELGRWFTPEEDVPGNHVVMLSYDTWQAHFGGDPAIVGQTVQIDGEATTVVGVMPASFSSVFLWGPTDVLRPMGFSREERTDLTSQEYPIIARRIPGTLALEEFNSRLATVSRQLAELRPKDRSEDGLRAVSLTAASRNPGLTTVSTMMVGLAGFVLLIACANLANLQIARAISRAHEFAIRSALGASRARLLRPQLAESLLLALAGGFAGLLVTVWANDWISSRLSSHGLFRLAIEVDWRVLSFAFGLSLLTGLLFGLVPAWLLGRIRVNESLKSGARGNTVDRTQHRLQHALIVTQFANAVMLLAGASGFLQAADSLVRPKPGWDQHTIAQTVLNLPPARYSTPQQTYAFYQRLQERLTALPGVENATVAWTLPVFQLLTSRSLVLEGKAPPAPGREPLAYINGIAPSYFETLGVKLQSGRNFTEADTLTSVPVAIINASMARALFPNEDPIGRRIGNTDPNNPAWMEIVGVFPDVETAVAGINQATPFQVMRPLAQEPWNYVTVAVRGTDPARLVEPLRQTVADLDPNLVPQQLGTIREVARIVTASASLMTQVLVGFAILGLLLAAIGLYGVISRVVAQRTTEIGVRVALGAQARDIVWLIVRMGLRLTILGTALGLAGALLIGIGLSYVIPDSSDSGAAPIVFVGIAVLLTVVGLVACWLPAHRAAQVDPMIALRAE